MGLNLEPVPENPTQKKMIATIVAGIAALALAITVFPHRWLSASQGEVKAGSGLFGFEACSKGDCDTMSNKELISTFNEIVDDPMGYEDDCFDGRCPIATQAVLAMYGPYFFATDDDDTFSQVAHPHASPEKKSSWWWMAGYATFAMLILSIAALVTAIVQVQRGKFFLGSLAPTSLSLISLFLTLIVGMIFVATNPTRGGSSTGALQLGVGWCFWLFGVGVVAGIVGTQMLHKFKPADPAWTA